MKTQPIVKGVYKAEQNLDEEYFQAFGITNLEALTNCFEKIEARHPELFKKYLGSNLAQALKKFLN